MILNMSCDCEQFVYCCQHLEKEAENLAKLRLSKYKSTVCSGWEVSLTQEIKCEIEGEQYHTIEIIYVHNPRDVDILAWYFDDKKCCYTML